MLISQITSNKSGSSLQSRLLLHNEHPQSSTVILSVQQIEALQWHGAQEIAGTECVEIKRRLHAFCLYSVGEDSIIYEQKWLGNT